MAGVQSIERAFALLRALAQGPLGVTELAERAELPKSTVARLLNALESEKVVEQVESGGQYRLGHGLADLAGAAAPGNNLITAARPHLQALTEQTGEAAGVSILEGPEVIYLDHVETEEEVQIRSWTGESVAAHLVPSGLVLLAELSDHELSTFLEQPLVRSTPASITEPADIRVRLQKTKKHGYVWCLSEFVDSINSVAAPIFDSSGTAIAALHIHGPAFRFPGDDDAEQLGVMVKESARALSAQLDQ